jgi:cell division protease FtsH
MTLPMEDKFLQTRSEMVDELALLLGGRTAEELVFHEPTTGASNDIEKATAIARAMVTTYGMSDKLGALKFGSSNGEPFLGRDMGHQRDYSEQVAADIDAEVRRLVEEAHDEAWEVLVEYRDVLDDLVLELMDKETLAKDEVLRVFEPVHKRPSRGTWEGNGANRTPSDRPPVMTPAELALLGTSAPGGSSPVRGGNGSSAEVPAGKPRSGAASGASSVNDPAPSDSSSD